MPTPTLARRTFLTQSILAAASASLLPQTACSGPRTRRPLPIQALHAEVVIIGASLGGCAAALAAASQGCRVILTEETFWIGGQLTSQAVPPDENRWIESRGCTRTYRALREGIRAFHRAHRPLTPAARSLPQLNPGEGSVSRLCHEPPVALAVIRSLLEPHLATGAIRILTRHRPRSATVAADRVTSVRILNLDTGASMDLTGDFFLDATELGDLLPLTGAEHVVGAESRHATGEPHAPEIANPANQQSFTVCFPVEYRPGESHVIDRPVRYGHWRNYVPPLTPPWPGRLLDLTYTHPQTLKPRQVGFNPEGPTPQGVFNLWLYRRIRSRALLNPGPDATDISLINWPQNDYLEGNLVGVSPSEAARHAEGARELSRCLLYWLQTEVPRPGGSTGWPGLKLRPDLTGTPDGYAMAPYIRESRRIQARFTVTEQHVGVDARRTMLGEAGARRAESFRDSVGIGHYNIDLHPSTTGQNYIDIPSLPFEIPLGALIPVRLKNLLPACKNLGTTHITNGCYRLHPVEWNIGEAAGHAAAFALRAKRPVQALVENPAMLADFQAELDRAGIERRWPDPLT